MSDSALDVTPDSSSQVTPPDGTAVDGDSAGADIKMVEASRFNGLMSKHQAALADLEQERTRRTALEARLQEKNTVADEQSALTEVQLLRQELQRERLETKKRELLERYPEAKPFADLFQGGSVDELEGVISAVAARVAALNPEPTTDGTPTPADGVAEGGDPAPDPTPAAPVVPIVGGTGAPPTGDPSQNPDAVKAALDSGDWNAYWAAKSPNPANLA